MNNKIKISNKFIGKSYKPFIIAEMSGNHNKSLDHALKIVKSVASSGADALKIQTYLPETMTLNIKKNEFLIKDEKSIWFGDSLYELYEKAYLPWEWHKEIFDYAKSLGLVVFSTPFDNTSVDFLESLDTPCYKIASFENTDLPLIKKVASTGKPLIISTGMASISEIDETVRTARNYGCKDLILLKCTSTYPASPLNSNLVTIPHMMDLFDCQIGLSDHTLGIGVSVASVSLGATIIEKHFTLNRKDGGVDSIFSMEPNEFKMLADETERAWQAIGKINYGPSISERKSLQFRRSLYIVDDLKKGDTLTENNLKAIRPGNGLPTKFMENLIGLPVNKNVKKGTPMSWELLVK